MFDASTDAAFLRSIIDEPDDDAPRLIYADWLDEQGDADRAEFIRLQVRLYRMSPIDPEYKAMRERSYELSQPHHVEWVHRLPQFEHVHWESFERGFVSAVRFTEPDVFFQHAGKVRKAAPIEEVRLHRFGWPEACRLGESKNLEGIRTLDLNDGNSIGNQGTEGLMKSPYLRALHSLKLGHNSLGSTAVRAIAFAPYMRQLRALKLERNDLYDDALSFLAESSNLVHLEELDLDRTRTGDSGLKALASTKYIKTLRILNLSHNQISASGVEVLVQSPVVKHLTTLFLQMNRLGDRGAKAIAESPWLRSLEFLFLRQNDIGDEGASALANSPQLSSLRHLFIGENHISDLAASGLRSAHGMGVNVY